MPTASDPCHSQPIENRQTQPPLAQPGWQPRRPYSREVIYQTNPSSSPIPRNKIAYFTHTEPAAGATNPISTVVVHKNAQLPLPSLTTRHPSRSATLGATRPAAASPYSRETNFQNEPIFAANTKKQNRLLHSYRARHRRNEPNLDLRHAQECTSAPVLYRPPLPTIRNDFVQPQNRSRRIWAPGNSRRTSSSPSRRTSRK